MARFMGLLLIALWSIRYSSMRLIRRGMSVTWERAHKEIHS
jgi:hypothetical protein